MKHLFLLLFTLFTLSPVFGQGYSWSTFAGKAGGPGRADGAGGQARFFFPRSVAVDGSGNVYVADTDNHTIRRITPAGEVSTLAGRAGIEGRADGAGGQARFNYPSGIAVDGGGTVYVADTFNQTIRRITSNGEVTTLAGRAGFQGSDDGAGGQARFANPYGIAVDGAGNVYVADTSNNTIRRITLDGEVSTLAGKAGVSGSTDGTAGEASFNSPRDVAVDGGGTVYVADADNHTIRRITPAGEVSTLAGLAGIIGSRDGAGGEGRFYFPAGIAVDAGGTVYVADLENHTIRKITSEGVVSTLAGSTGAWGSEDGSGREARFDRPAGIAVDGVGNVYVSDTRNNAIRKITPEGVVSTLAGMAGIRGSADGTGGEARFYFPTGIAVDGGGNLYVADMDSSTIRKGTAEALTALELWRQTRFGFPANSGAGADGSDPDGDGLVNLMEFALGLDPQATSASPHSLSTGGNGGEEPLLLFNYRRSAAAFDAGTVFTVEWSDDPAGPWSVQGVTESVLFAGGDLQSMRAVLSAGTSGRRFVRLKVSAP